MTPNYWMSLDQISVYSHNRRDSTTTMSSSEATVGQIDLQHFLMRNRSLSRDELLTALVFNISSFGIFSRIARMTNAFCFAACVCNSADFKQALVDGHERGDTIHFWVISGKRR